MIVMRSRDLIGGDRQLGISGSRTGESMAGYGVGLATLTGWDALYAPDPYGIISA